MLFELLETLISSPLAASLDDHCGAYQFINMHVPEAFVHEKIDASKTEKQKGCLSHKSTLLPKSPHEYYLNVIPIEPYNPKDGIDGKTLPEDDAEEKARKGRPQASPPHLICAGCLLKELEEKSLFSIKCKKCDRMISYKNVVEYIKSVAASDPKCKDYNSDSSRLATRLFFDLISETDPLTFIYSLECRKRKTLAEFRDYFVSARNMAQESGNQAAANSSLRSTDIAGLFKQKTSQWDSFIGEINRILKTGAKASSPWLPEVADKGIESTSNSHKTLYAYSLCFPIHKATIEEDIDDFFNTFHLFDNYNSVSSPEHLSFANARVLSALNQPLLPPRQKLAYCHPYILNIMGGDKNPVVQAYIDDFRQTIGDANRSHELVFENAVQFEFGPSRDEVLPRIARTYVGSPDFALATFLGMVGRLGFFVTSQCFEEGIEPSAAYNELDKVLETIQKGEVTEESDVMLADACRNAVSNIDKIAKIMENERAILLRKIVASVVNTIVKIANFPFCTSNLWELSYQIETFFFIKKDMLRLKYHFLVTPGTIKGRAVLSNPIKAVVKAAGSRDDSETLSKLVRLFSDPMLVNARLELFWKIMALPAFSNARAEGLNAFIEEDIVLYDEGGESLFHRTIKSSAELYYAYLHALNLYSLQRHYSAKVKFVFTSMQLRTQHKMGLVNLLGLKVQGTGEEPKNNNDLESPFFRVSKEMRDLIENIKASNARVESESQRLEANLGETEEELKKFSESINKLGDLHTETAGMASNLHCERRNMIDMAKKLNEKDTWKDIESDSEEDGNAVDILEILGKFVNKNANIDSKTANAKDADHNAVDQKIADKKITDNMAADKKITDKKAADNKADANNKLNAVKSRKSPKKAVIGNPSLSSKPLEKPDTQPADTKASPPPAKTESELASEKMDSYDAMCAYAFACYYNVILDEELKECDEYKMVVPEMPEKFLIKMIECLVKRAASINSPCLLSLVLHGAVCQLSGNISGGKQLPINTSANDALRIARNVLWSRVDLKNVCLPYLVDSSGTFVDGLAFEYFEYQYFLKRNIRFGIGPVYVDFDELVTNPNIDLVVRSFNQKYFIKNKLINIESFNDVKAVIHDLNEALLSSDDKGSPFPNGSLERLRPLFTEMMRQIMFVMRGTTTAMLQGKNRMVDLNPCIDIILDFIIDKETAEPKEGAKSAE